MQMICKIILKTNSSLKNCGKFQTNASLSNQIYVKTLFSIFSTFSFSIISIDFSFVLKSTKRRGIFRTLFNIYDETILRKWSTASSHQLLCKKFKGPKQACIKMVKPYRNQKNYSGKSLAHFKRYTAQERKFFSKDFFSRCDQIRANLITFTE